MSNVTERVMGSNKRMSEYGLVDFLYWFSGNFMEEYETYGELDRDELIEIAGLVTPLLYLSDEDNLIEALSKNRGLIYRSLRGVDRLGEWVDQIRLLDDEEDEVLYAIESSDLIVVIRVSGVLKLIEDALSQADRISERLEEFKRRNK